MDITSKCLEYSPSATVLVATIKALKYNGGVSKDNIMNKDIESLKKGLSNLEAHIDNLFKFNIPFVVCLNKYSSDSEEEVNLVREYCFSKGIPMEVSTAYLEAGGVYPEFKKNDNIDKIESKMRASGYECTRE